MSTVGRSSLFPFILRARGPMTSALTLSASEHAAVRPVSYDVIPGQTSSGRANSMPILRYADSSWLTGRAQSDGRIRIVARPIHRRMTSDERLFYVHIGIATDSRATAQRPRGWPTRCHIGS